MSTFTAVDNAIIDNYLIVLKGATLSVYLYLRRCSDIDGKKVWPTNETIAKATGYSTKQVSRATKQLEAMNLIHIERTYNKQTGHKKNYFHFLTPGDMDVPRPTDTDVPRQETPTSSGTGHGCPNNNTKRTRPSNNTQTLKKETIVREYETEAPNLEDAVVAILKNLKVDKSFWPSVSGRGVNRVQALAELAKKKATKNPGGWFRKAVDGGWDIPGHDKRAFEMQCDLVRKTSDILVSKHSGIEYEILKYKTGPQIVIMTDRDGETIIDEKELEKFTWQRNAVR